MKTFQVLVLFLCGAMSFAHRNGGGGHSGGHSFGGGFTSFTCSETTRTLDDKQIQEIKAQIGKIIKDDKIAHAVRIAFHDCVDGCDGCINIKNPDNFGPMLETLTKLDNLFDNKRYKRYLTRADFYALTGIYAIEEGIRNANLDSKTATMFTPRFRFNYCRQDCKTSPATDVIRAFPHGHFNYTQVMSFFKKQFGLDERLSTALMGAHTLGGAAGSSGFLGFWKEDADEAKRFDNRYYQLMVDPKVKWNQVDKSPVTNNPNERWQWDGFRRKNQVSFMLQADVAIYRQVQTDTNGKSACAPFADCPASPTASLVELYAEDGNIWLRDFIEAFTRMIEAGSRGRLVRPQGDRDGGDSHHHFGGHRG